MTPKKWQLVSSKDVSPHAFFPIEMRTYKLPNGSIVDDFSVTTIPDVAMVVPITIDNLVVLVSQFKPGAGDVILEFPAGRLHSQESTQELAQLELEEETGIRVSLNSLKHFATLNGFTTKGTEKVFFYLATECEFNSNQKLDDNEDIEVVTLTFSELDKKIMDGEIWAAQTIAGWELAKIHFPEFFRKRSAKNVKNS